MTLDQQKKLSSSSAKRSSFQKARTHRRGSSTVCPSSPIRSASLKNIKDADNDATPRIVRYTSLRDIMPPPPSPSNKTTEELIEEYRNQMAREVTIKDPLVRKAALLYLSPIPKEICTSQVSNLSTLVQLREKLKRMFTG